MDAVALENAKATAFASRNSLGEHSQILLTTMMFFHDGLHRLLLAKYLGIKLSPDHCAALVQCLSMSWSLPWLFVDVICIPLSSQVCTLLNLASRALYGSISGKMHAFPTPAVPRARQSTATDRSSFEATGLPSRLNLDVTFSGAIESIHPGSQYERRF